MVGVGHERLHSDNTVDSEGVDERLRSNGDGGGEERAREVSVRAQFEMVEAGDERPSSNKHGRDGKRAFEMMEVEDV